MIKRTILGMAVVGIAVLTTGQPAHGWDCSLPENSGVAECPVLTTTSTAAPTTSTSTSTVPVTTSTQPVTTTTVPATVTGTVPTSTTTTTECTEGRGCEVTPQFRQGQPELPFTGQRDMTGPLLVGAACFLAGFGLVGGAAWRKRRTS